MPAAAHAGPVPVPDAAQRVVHARDLSRVLPHEALALRTRYTGALGYVQLHVDPAASRRAAARAGLGVWGFDSVSELYLESQETFLRALAKSGFGKEPIEDEEVFVDRANSLDLCSTVDWGA